MTKNHPEEENIQEDTLKEDSLKEEKLEEDKIEEKEKINLKKIEEELKDKITEERLNEIKVKLQRLVRENDQYKQRTAELEKQLKEHNLLSLAEMDNLRKRCNKEIDDAKKYATSTMSRDLIEVMENLMRALSYRKSVKEAEISCNGENSNIFTLVNSFFEGVEMTLKTLQQTFDKQGIIRIYPLNEQFNPDYHQAISHLESKETDNSILEVIQAGYKIHDRLIRPALVVVAKNH